MKNNKISKTLTLSKTTISNLTGAEMDLFKGGVVSFTLLKDECMSNHPDFCPPTRYTC